MMENVPIHYSTKTPAEARWNIYQPAEEYSYFQFYMSSAPSDLWYYILLWMLAAAIQLIAEEDWTTGVLAVT